MKSRGYPEEEKIMTLRNLIKRLNWQMEDPVLPVKIYGSKKLYGVWVDFDPEIAEDWEMLNMNVDDWFIGVAFVSYGMFSTEEMLIVTVDDDPEIWR
jgi:hypothetical protein